MEVSKSSVSQVGHEERVIPHYLRASTGSCHDFCKYGRKQKFEKERRHESQHKVAGKVKHDSVKSFVAANMWKTAVKWKKVSGAKLKSSHGTKILAQDPPDLTKSIDDDEYGKKTPSPRFSSSGSSELFDVVRRSDGLHVEENQACQLVHVINEDDLSPTEKVEHNNVVSDKLPDSPNNLDASVDRTFPSEQLETIEVEIPLAPDLAIIKESKPLTQPNETYPPEEIKEVKQETKVIHRNVPSVKRSKSSASPKVKQTMSPALRMQGSSPNPKTNMGKPPRKFVKPSELNPTSPSKKLTASVMKSKISSIPRVSATSSRMKSTTSTGKKTVALTMKKSQPSLNVSSVQARTLNVNDKVSKKPVLSKMEEKKVLYPTRLSPHRPRRTEDPALNLRNHREDRSSGRTKESEGSVKEKTIYVVKPTEQTVNPIDSNDQWSSPSMPSSSSSSLGSSFDGGQDEELDGCNKIHGKDETFSDYEMDNDQHESLHDVGKQQQQQQQLGKAALDQSEDPHKVKFRRGKTVNAHSADSGPRRLKFRQGRVLDDNQRGNDDRKRIFRKKEIVRHDSVPKTETEIVMLRHQDVQDKDTQGLFNDVIEVTASRLVEARKSKVKALVGAFETVISLQESKPASL